MVHKKLTPETNPIHIIDFSKEENLRPGSSSRLSMCNQIRFALEENGCFVAKYDKLSSQLTDDIFCQSKDLFKLPTETKVKNTSDEPYHGYIGQHPHLPLYEGLAVDNATNFDEVQKFMNLMWPDGKQNFCEIAHSYASLLASLKEIIIQMVFESYGASKHYGPIAATNCHLLRFIRYKEPEGCESDMRFPAHNDLTFTTFIHQYQLGGLEVETKDGDWVGLEVANSQIVFMAGDALKVWSNDRIKSCKHRVRLSAGNGPRYSVGIFTFNNGVIEVPKEVVDDKYPLAYKSFDHRGFIRFFVSQEAKNHQNRLKAYCGV